MAENRPLPEIPECSIERDGDGFQVRHEDTGEVRRAADERQAVIKGLLLRVRASWARDPELRTGDPT